MDENEYAATNLVVFTQQCHSGLKRQFEDTFDKIVKFSEDNNLAKPKKQDFLNKIFSDHLSGYTPEVYFGKS